jgi:hypothetical protein
MGDQHVHHRGLPVLTGNKKQRPTASLRQTRVGRIRHFLKNVGHETKRTLGALHARGLLSRLCRLQYRPPLLWGPHSGQHEEVTPSRTCPLRPLSQYPLTMAGALPDTDRASASNNNDFRMCARPSNTRTDTDYTYRTGKPTPQR